MKYFRPLDASVSNIPGDPAPVMREAFTTSRMLDFVSDRRADQANRRRTSDWPRVLIKELVDNALDACEEAGVAPVVEIEIDRPTVTVTDQRPGHHRAMIDGGSGLQLAHVEPRGPGRPDARRAGQCA